MAKIASGESGGDYNARYGFPDLPGAPGPQGESHALGKYQFEPGTWKQAASAYHAAHPGAPAPSFNNPVDQDRVARGWAIRTYGVDKNGHTLPEAAAAGTVDYARLAGQWPSLAPHSLQAQWGSLTPEEQALQHQRTTETQELQGRLTKQLQDATAYAMSKPEGSKERDEAIADLRRDNAEMMREWREKIMSPPVAKPMDAWQNMGNAGFILAALAGLFSRQHITAGLAAAGNALNAINQNSHEEFKRQYEIWKDQVQLGSQMISMENQDIRNLLEDRKMDFDEKQAQVATMFQTLGLESQIGQLGLKNVDTAQQMLQQRDTLLMQFKLGIQKTEEMATNRAWVPMEYTDPKTGKPSTIRYNTLTTKATDLQGNPIDLPQGANLQKTGTQYNARSAPAMYAQKYLQDHPDATEGDLSKAMANYRYSQAVATAFGGGIMGRNLDSLNTVADHVLLVKQYAQDLRNGNIPAANKIANRIATETGHAEVTTFEAGRDIMADEVVRLLTTTGGTEADRKSMQERMAQWFAPAQFAGVFDAFVDLTGGRFRAIEQHYAHNDPQRRSEFENDMLTPEAREVFGAFRSPLMAVAPHGSIPPRPASIPAGSAFSPSRQQWRSPDGKLYDAQGNPL